MSNDTKDKIIKLLTDYPELKRKINLLRYELEHPATVTPEDLLESMNFAKGTGEGHPSGSVSNKTLYIAMNYKYEAEKMNTDNVSEILSRLLPLEQQAKKIEYYLSLLSRDEQEVIRRFFFERESLNSISESMGISLWATRKIRNDTIQKLSEMHDFVNGSE